MYSSFSKIAETVPDSGFSSKRLAVLDRRTLSIMYETETARKRGRRGELLVIGF